MMPEVLDQEFQMVPVGLLRTHPQNPRQGDIGAIYDSIEHNGFYGALVAQKGTGYVLAGNHRLMAAVRANIDKVPVMWLDASDDAALRILLADNKTSDDAYYNTQTLVDLLTGLAKTDRQLSGSGYSGDDVDDLLRDLSGVPNTTEGQGAGKNEGDVKCPDCGCHFTPGFEETKRAMATHHLGGKKRRR